MLPSTTSGLNINDAEISYNYTWMNLQFDNYDLSFESIDRLVKSGLRDGNKSDNIPFATSEILPSNIFIRFRENSNSKKGCILLLIHINQDQYLALQKAMPKAENKTGPIY